jgi:hypothetical protein
MLLQMQIPFEIFQRGQIANVNIIDCPDVLVVTTVRQLAPFHKAIGLV